MLFFIQLSYAYECLSFGFIQGLEHAIAGTDLVVGTILEELKWTATYLYSTLEILATF